jgi:hypothetical protein
VVDGFGQGAQTGPTRVAAMLAVVRDRPDPRSRRGLRLQLVGAPVVQRSDQLGIGAPVGIELGRVVAGAVGGHVVRSEPGHVATVVAARAGRDLDPAGMLSQRGRQLRRQRAPVGAHHDGDAVGGDAAQEQGKDLLRGHLRGVCLVEEQRGNAFVEDALLRRPATQEGDDALVHAPNQLPVEPAAALGER